MTGKTTNEIMQDPEIVSARAEAARGHWECDCGRECRDRGIPGCRARWVRDDPPRSDLARAYDAACMRFERAERAIKDAENERDLARAACARLEKEMGDG